jgi:thiamine-phosphate pyrophosphorylase
LRYLTYELEQQLVEPATRQLPPPVIPDPAHDASAAQLETTADKRQQRLQRLSQASLYVLLTESNCRLPWKTVVEQCLQSAVDVIQLREKHLSDRELVRRGRWIRDAAEAANALFILNDRADLAEVCGADGVHIGQDDTDIALARRFLHPSRLVGVSTHDVPQAVQAVQDNADYIGAGPVFPSTTKSFIEFPGLQFLQQVTQAVSLPTFAIGGITSDSVSQITQTGATRIAVSSTVIADDHPGHVAAQLKQALQHATSSPAMPNCE